MIKDYTLEDLKKDCRENDLDFEKMHKIVEEWDAKKWALFFEDGGAIAIEDIDLLDIDASPVHYNGEDFLILTDDEADEAWEDSLESYIDEVILPEIPDSYRYYFDRESWKNDARLDGRALSISMDGDERYYNIEFDDGSSQDIYIYRV